MRLKGLIAAAGRSRRMDGFKPFMKLNGFPMICMTVQSLKNAGIEDITVVTGYRAQETEAVLKPLGVKTVENTAYADTDMLYSVQMGLRRMKDADAVFFLPGDVPMVSPGSMQKMKAKLTEISDQIQVYQPVVGLKKAHPPVLLPSAYNCILTYKGEGGLGGAFSAMRVKAVELKDAGALADADFREDFEKLRDFAMAHKGVSLEVCEALYEKAGLPEHIRTHCRAVGELAGSIAGRLTAHGACLDIELCRSGGYLHDLCRLSDSHEAAAGLFLRKEGYLALAEIVEKHKGFTEEPKTICEESVIVCMADKLIREDKRVPLEVRYEKALRMDQVKERILHDIRILRRLTEEFEVITGERL